MQSCDVIEQTDDLDYIQTFFQAVELQTFFVRYFDLDLRYCLNIN
jgi:hypothetical protein